MVTFLDNAILENLSYIEPLHYQINSMNRITSKHNDDNAVMMQIAADDNDDAEGSSGTKRKRNDLVDDEVNPTRATSAKQSEVMEHRQKQKASLSTTTTALDRTKRKNDTNREIVTMNLSDSSSDDDSE